jgi:hypothetical protein
VDAHIGEVETTVRAVDALPLTPEELDRIVREVLRRLDGVPSARHEADTRMRNGVLGPAYPGVGGAS